jgi:DNA invertase Pin-like site-specific DNA recombinase
LSLI